MATEIIILMSDSLAQICIATILISAIFICGDLNSHANCFFGYVVFLMYA